PRQSFGPLCGGRTSATVRRLGAIGWWKSSEKFMLSTYVGSCHCGAIRFEADIDFSLGTAKCNCSICAKSRAWGAIVQPSAFRLMQGEQDLSVYQFGPKRVHHYFCKHCGVHPFEKGYH